MNNDSEIERIATQAVTGKRSGEDVLFLLERPEFEQRPVPAQKFIVSPEYLNCPQMWPEVQKIIGDLFVGAEDGKRFSKYREFIFDAGIGSGKSFIVSCIFSYIAYWLCCLKDPQGYFKLAPGSEICLINASTSGLQAKRVVFGNIKARIDASPWFQKYALPNPNIRSELRFPKNIVIFPGSSSETAPLGYNVLAANVDEASWFIETDVHNTASDVFDVLERRIKSRFGGLGFGLISVTSSPRYVDDFTEKKIEDARHDEDILAVRRATWEMRPDDLLMIANGAYFELSPAVGSPAIKIPMKYEKTFKKNPRKAWRDFGAVASLVLEAYFQEDEINLLDAILSRNDPPSLFLNGEINPAAVPVPGVFYNVHIDLGLRRDACGFAMGYSPTPDKVVVSAIARITCEQRARELQEKNELVDIIIGQEQVNIDGVLNLIYSLAGRGFCFGLITFDNFQSIHSRQQLEARGFATDYISVDKDTEAYDTLKSLIRGGGLRACAHQIFFNECKRLELTKGKKIDHPPNGSKDCADAVAGVCASLLMQFDEPGESEEIVHDDSIRIDISQEI